MRLRWAAQSLLSQALMARPIQQLYLWRTILALLVLLAIVTLLLLPSTTLADVQAGLWKVDEPAILLLLGVALIAAAAYVRRRRLTHKK